MKLENYIWSQLLSVFLHLLDDKEKRKECVIKINNAINRINHKPKHTLDKTYYQAADIVEYAIKESWNMIEKDKTITINAICWMINNRHSKELKKYKFNIKHFEQLSKQGVAGYALESAKVLNIIEQKVKEKLGELNGSI